MHVPLLQTGVPVGQVHALPQEPQLLMLVFLFVSQPLTGLPSQLAQPLLHTGAHTPLEQEVVPLGFTHATPQAPQLPVEVAVFVSQPFAAFASQSAKPGLHAGTHAPATHEVVPLGLTHAVPHAPQWGTVVNRLVSQPLLASPSQLAKPALHDGVHRPAVQVVGPFGLTQAIEQVPQCAVVLSGDSQPLVPMPSQFPNPALQATSAHAPVEQDSEALGRSQTAPHAPQLARLCRNTSQPLAASPSQFA